MRNLGEPVEDPWCQRRGWVFSALRRRCLSSRLPEDLETETKGALNLITAQGKTGFDLQRLPASVRFRNGAN